MNQTIRWLLLLVVAGVFAAILYNWLRAPGAPPPPPVQAPAPPAPAAVPEPQSHFPVPQQPEAKLPALDASDAALREGLEALGGKALLALLNAEQFVRKVVATVDNLPRRKLAPRLNPLRPAAGRFLADGADEDATMSPKNAARYEPYVRIAEHIDTKRLVALYVRLYPLFQQAYQDLGYPSGYFNDRLIAVIDHLLAAPEPKEPVRLLRPKVYYQFADAGLEARSAGEKIMIRIGAANAARVKHKLREIRAEITRSAPRQ
ncbi:MAG TPA: DUF3014 domain-containing protein [Burkholderiales bacterium]|nr:DUF3014 domain-containing protein [Burkholderiales bacterium]